MLGNFIILFESEFYLVILVWFCSLVILIFVLMVIINVMIIVGNVFVIVVLKKIDVFKKIVNN